MMDMGSGPSRREPGDSGCGHMGVRNLAMLQLGMFVHLLLVRGRGEHSVIICATKLAFRPRLIALSGSHVF
jgi:hypothetical protein